MRKTTPQDPKEALRAQIREARKAIPITTRLDDEEAIAARLLALPAVKHAQVFGVYHATGSEASLAKTVDALRGLEQMPVIAYPLVVSSEAMVFARFSAGEDLRLLDNPKKLHTDIDHERVIRPEEIDVMLVPGVAFDEHGNRLGQGGGYYDRYLTHLRPDALTIGIAFDEQIVEEVPHHPHDRSVGYVVTPTRLITAR